MTGSSLILWCKEKLFFFGFWQPDVLVILQRLFIPRFVSFFFRQASGTALPGNGEASAPHRGTGTRSQGLIGDGDPGGNHTLADQVGNLELFLRTELFSDLVQDT